MNSKLACLVACAVASTALPAVATAAAYKAPRNAFGQPDLGGIWTNETLTGMSRPAMYGDRLVATPEEVAAAESGKAAQIAESSKPTDPNASTKDLESSCEIKGADLKVSAANCSYNAVWVDSSLHMMRVGGQPRTSLITFPANGRIPYKPGKGIRPNAWEVGNTDNPENRGLPDRCLVSQNISNGALLNPTLYNNTYVFQQSKDTVAIVVEMAHDVRLVRLNAEHSSLPKWFGDSVGHWEGDTLVVDTINFHPEQLAYNSPRLHLVERFTRVAPDRVLYQFRIEDPETYTQPWGGEYEFRSQAGLQQYEYACHEGNHGLLGILAGARAEEREQRQKQAAAGAPGG